MPVANGMNRVPRPARNFGPWPANKGEASAAKFVTMGVARETQEKGIP